jgi:hypothetical protein
MSDSPPRPRDLALLWLASLGGPPRQRPRDAQADMAGIELLRQLLDHLVAHDPEPEDVEASLMQMVSELGEPTGPARSLAAQVLDAWRAFTAAPLSWGWLMAEAVEATSCDRQRKRKGSSWMVPESAATSVFVGDTSHGAKS